MNWVVELRGLASLKSVGQAGVNAAVVRQSIFFPKKCQFSNLRLSTNLMKPIHMIED